MPKPSARYQVTVALKKVDFDRLRKLQNDGNRVIDIFRRGLEVSEIQEEHNKNKK